MNTISRGERGRNVALTASILAVVAVGLAGCQTGDADRTTEDQTSVAQQVARTNAAAQSRYEGQAQYWEQRALQADATRATVQVPVVADRLERTLERAVIAVPVVADRLEQALERVVIEVPVVADRLETHE